MVPVFLAGYSFLRFVEFGIYGELLFPLSILRDSAESNRKYHRKENILHFVCTDKIAPSYHLSVIGMIRDGELSSKAMRKKPW